jgi:hypothetical protein
MPAAGYGGHQNRVEPASFGDFEEQGSLFLAHLAGRKISESGERSERRVVCGSRTQNNRSPFAYPRLKISFMYAPNILPPAEQ